MKLKACALLLALARQGKRVLLVDADARGSALDWAELRDDKDAFPRRRAAEVDAAQGANRSSPQTTTA